MKSSVWRVQGGAGRRGSESSWGLSHQASAFHMVHTAWRHREWGLTAFPALRNYSLISLSKILNLTLQLLKSWSAPCCYDLMLSQASVRREPDATVNEHADFLEKGLRSLWPLHPRLPQVKRHWHVILRVSSLSLSVTEDVKPYQVNGVNPTYPESRYTSDYFISKFSSDSSSFILWDTWEGSLLLADLWLLHGNPVGNDLFLNIDFSLCLFFFLYDFPQNVQSFGLLVCVNLSNSWVLSRRVKLSFFL